MRTQAFIGACFLLCSINLQSGTLNKDYFEESRISKYNEQVEPLNKDKYIDKILPIPMIDGKIKSKFSDEARIKISDICKDINTKEEYLYLLIYKESGGNPKARNKYSKATGYIQFLPSTAVEYNTTIEEIINMTDTEQLELCHNYFKNKFKNYKRKGNCIPYSDLYLSVAFPAHLNSSAYEVLADTTTRWGKKVLKGNPNWDTNDDNIITMQEFRAYHNSIIAKI
jgi:hypothetical protein